MSVSAKGHRFSPMAVAHPFQTLRTYRPGPAAQLLIGLALALAVALVVIGPDRLQAQIEGERGIAPVATSTDIQIGGIAVVVGQPVDMMGQGIQTCCGEDSRLAHAAPGYFPPAAGSGDKIGIAAQDRANGRAKTF